MFVVEGAGRGALLSSSIETFSIMVLILKVFYMCNKFVTWLKNSKSRENIVGLLHSAYKQLHLQHFF